MTHNTLVGDEVEGSLLHRRAKHTICAKIESSADALAVTSTAPTFPPSSVPTIWYGNVPAKGFALVPVSTNDFWRAMAFLLKISAILPTQ